MRSPSAEFLQRHPRIKTVHYPGLPSHPQHALARKQMQDFGTMVSIELDGGYARKRAASRSP